MDYRGQCEFSRLQNISKTNSITNFHFNRILIQVDISGSGAQTYWRKQENRIQNLRYLKKYLSTQECQVFVTGLI